MPQPSTIPQPTLPPNPDETGADNGNNARKGGWRSVASTLGILIAAPILAICLTAFVFQSYEVEGQSMENTLQHKDRLIVLKIPRTIARITGKSYIPERGEIVVFTKHGLSQYGGEARADKQLIKRVIGLPGERVVIKDGSILVFNKDNPAGFDPDTDGGYGNVERTTPIDVDVTVPEGQVFVCGDNRTNSLDSRTFGSVPSEDIIGSLAFRLLPVSKAKFF
jgi:signal peptidase I